MSEVIQILAWLFAVLLAIPCFVFFAECVVGVIARGAGAERGGECDNERERNGGAIAVVIPAHNEQMMIGRTVEAVKKQLRENDRLIVVADNCSDETAAFARTAGAEVWERQHETLRGKGYALAYAVEKLEGMSPDVVVFLDADCQLSDGAIDVLVEQVRKTGKPVQCSYIMGLPGSPSSKDRISAFAFAVKGLIRTLGLRKLGGVCHVMGTGMAFPWKALNKIELASGNIVEDMKMGVDLVLLGYPTQYCNKAKVFGTLPGEREEATTQRTRWEHGHLSTLLTYSPLLIFRGAIKGNWAAVALGLDLLVPPLAMLVGLVVLMVGASGTLWLTGFSFWPFGLATGSLGLVTVGVLMSWVAVGREILPFRVLLSVPMYVLWKLPIYVGFLFHRETKWKRTGRDEVG